VGRSPPGTPLSALSASYELESRLGAEHCGDPRRLSAELVDMSRSERTERLDQELEASATLFSPPDAGDPPVDEECRMRAGAAQEDPLPLLGDQLIARVAPDDVDVVVREQPYTPRHAVRERVAAQDVPDVIGQLPSEPVLDLVAPGRMSRDTDGKPRAAQCARRAGANRRPSDRSE
jgi:hypothetical protein